MRIRFPILKNPWPKVFFVFSLLTYGFALCLPIPASKPIPTQSKSPKPIPMPMPVPAANPTPPKPAIPQLPAPLRIINHQAFKAPEKLVFEITWGGWGFKWVSAGEATLELLPMADSSQMKIQSLARCNHFFESFYPVRDTVISIIDIKGVYPLKFEKILHEGSYHAKISATYDQINHVLKTLDTTLTIDPFTHDVLSAFYFIRTQKFKVGDSFDLAAVSGKKKYSLRVLCHRKEEIEVTAGRFQTLVVEPILKGDGLFKAKGKLTIWVTDDSRHMPVKMESKIPVGSIKAELISQK